MRKVNKDLLNIPFSLRNDEESIKSDPAKTTNEKRMKVIADKKYPDSNHSDSFDSRYKYKDIKAALLPIYHNKCAFCETIVEQLHVEHYRPKRGGYYWLAFSWDNLLLACPTCNTNKGSDFPLENEDRKISYEENPDVLRNINTISSSYDAIERPLLINPESVDPDIFSALCFNQDGSVWSENNRLSKTIELCGLDRVALCHSRKKIWDDLKKDIHIAFDVCKGDKNLLETSMELICKSFMEKANDEDNAYIAFRKYVLSSGWIRQELKSINRL